MAGTRVQSERRNMRNILMQIENISRGGKQFAVIPVRELQKLIDDSEMLADVKAYDAAKARVDLGEDEIIPLKITELALQVKAQ